MNSRERELTPQNKSRKNKRNFQIKFLASREDGVAKMSKISACSDSERG